jgi:3,4-dihydroxy 2-butanone 4-phosphate synthase/GTP cyclohydrolase II
MSLDSIESILEDARAGKMFILVDDESRENEGDLVISAGFCDAAAVNFMAKYGRGLICLALVRTQADRLGLKLMAQHNTSRHETAFTVSIEAREGVTTGISAADRAHTVAVAIDPASTPTDIATPGHVFPLVAKDGGVLIRAGHTEAAVDIARLAGHFPAGVICEIMNDDGTMARLPDLIPFARQHGLKIGTIADLISYRRRSEKLVQAADPVPFASEFGGQWQAIVYTNTLTAEEHLVLQKGEIAPGAGQPVWVRMHAADPLRDALGDIQGGKQGELGRAMQKIADHGTGVVVILRDTRQTLLSDSLALRQGHAPSRPMLRDYGIGAQILLDRGVREMILLSNSRASVIALEGYGLAIAGYEGI